MYSSKNNSFLDRPSSRYIKLQVQYGSDIYELLLSSKDNKIRVEHVLDEIERLTKIPKCHQSVMYKGQRLDYQPKANLDTLYIFNNSKLTLTAKQKQCHDKYCCHQHDQNQMTIVPSKSISSQQSDERMTNIREERQNLSIKPSENSKESSLIETQASLVYPKKQEIHSNPIGFIPEPNKNYEYYTVPYKTDPATLLQRIPPSTSNVH